MSGFTSESCFSPQGGKDLSEDPEEQHGECVCSCTDVGMGTGVGEEATRS